MTRVTLKLDKKTIEHLKENARKEGKSLAEFMVDRSIIFEDYLISGIALFTSFISQKSFIAGIYRVDVDVSEIKYGRRLLIRKYEVWASEKAIQEKFNIGNTPSLPELAEFAFGVIKGGFEENKDQNEDRELLNVYGYFVTHNQEIKVASSREDLWKYLDEITPKEA